MQPFNCTSCKYFMYVQMCKLSRYLIRQDRCLQFWLSSSARDVFWIFLSKSLSVVNFVHCTQYTFCVLMNHCENIYLLSRLLFFQCDEYFATHNHNSQPLEIYGWLNIVSRTKWIFTILLWKTLALRVIEILSENDLNKQFVYFVCEIVKLGWQDHK